MRVQQGLRIEWAASSECLPLSYWFVHQNSHGLRPLQAFGALGPKIFAGSRRRPRRNQPLKCELTSAAANSTYGTVLSKPTGRATSLARKYFISNNLRRLA